VTAAALVTAAARSYPTLARLLRTRLTSASALAVSWQAAQRHAAARPLALPPEARGRRMGRVGNGRRPDGSRRPLIGDKAVPSHPHPRVPSIPSPHKDDLARSPAPRFSGAALLPVAEGANPLRIVVLRQKSSGGSKLRHEDLGGGGGAAAPGFA